MGTYILRRFFLSIFVLVGLTIVVFAVTHVIGDPARLMLPVEASEAQYQSLRHQLGFDQPFYVQFGKFIFDVARGDFGISFWQNVPAMPLVLSRFPATLYLAFCTLMFSMLISIPIGLASGIRPRTTLDRITSVLSISGLSVPTFWLALMLILVFAVNFRWFRTSGFGGFDNLILPMLALSAPIIGRLTQMIRSSMLDEVSKPYLTTARSKGLRENTIIVRHALKNAAIPIVTLAGDELAHLVGASIVIEVIFGWPGVGQLILNAIQQRDFPVVQCAVIVVASAVVTVNLLVDITYAFLDPRIRYI